VDFGGRNQRRTIRGTAGNCRGNGINDLVYLRALLVEIWCGYAVLVSAACVAVFGVARSNGLCCIVLAEFSKYEPSSSPEELLYCAN
jgi:hypothetical protein